MPVNRFWSSNWSVVVYLATIGVLQYIITIIASGFGLVPVSILGRWILPVVEAVAPILGTLAYLDWRWGWKLEHIGMANTGRNALRALLGLVLGLVAFLAVHVASTLLAGGGIALTTGVTLPSVSLFALAVLLVSSYSVEMVFRGAVASRFQADLEEWEMVGAAVLAPVLWIVVRMVVAFLLPIRGPNNGIDSFWAALMSVALSLLYLRTDSAWLTAGLRAGMIGGLSLLNLGTTDQGALLVWGVIAVVLLALEWFRQRSLPRRVKPRRGPQRVVYGRTIRGPWGPH